ncbi:MAG: MFS transporter [Holophagales bacterium]|nr:MFS transporter [Holophagales bacterium]
MFKGHPKGLYVAFLANMGERFGFYTMMGILVLFLQAKFNLDAGKAGLIYSIFYFSIYALALLGGFIADRTQNYKGVVAVGVTIMFLGYFLLAIPGFGLVVACVALGTIALGNGLFKGNLQALVGQMYDNPQYSGLRDSAYSIFYMGINVGAMFAPNAAVWVQKWYLKQNGYEFFPKTYNLCKQFSADSLKETSQLYKYASDVTGQHVTDFIDLGKLGEFTNATGKPVTDFIDMGKLGEVVNATGKPVIDFVDLGKLGEVAKAAGLSFTDFMDMEKLGEVAKAADQSVADFVMNKLGEVANATGQSVSDFMDMGKLGGFVKNYMDMLSKTASDVTGQPVSDFMDLSKLGEVANATGQSASDFMDMNKLGEVANATGQFVTEFMDLGKLGEFVNNYLNVFSTGYHYAFGIAGVAMLISLTSYLFFKRHLPEKKNIEAGSADVPQMPKAEEKQRLLALGLVFLVVIFFWMSFHQNGLTMTFFARDCTVTSVAPLSNLLFDIRSLLSIGLGVLGLVLALKPSSTGKTRLLGAVMAVVFGAVVYYLYNGFKDETQINPAIFQQFNAFFVVFLTPVIVGLFAWLRSKGKEPSAPRKIGIGMIIAALGFVVLLIGSLGMPIAPVVKGHQIPLQETMLVSTQWLIQSYLVLTIAELFLSPMGISFVSKVAPPRLQGLMQGGWLCATAIGNQLLFVGPFFWSRVPIWGVWLIFIVCCLISATVIFSLLRRLELVAK